VASQRIACIILDFDGTFTDVEREAAPFVESFQASVFDLLGRDAREAWQAAAAAIAREPTRHGWTHEGRVVAPAAADPYIRSTTAAQLVFDAAGVLRDGRTRAGVVQVLYHLAYERTATAFRPEAREVLETLVRTGIAVHVVTNAKTDVVERKLRTLWPEGLAQVTIVGDARKFVVGEPEHADPRFARVPEKRYLPGLERPVYPRRGRYFEALARILDETGARPEEALVCGDIFELDLTLPIELGMNVHLVTGPQTPAYEIAALQALGPRASHGALRGVLDRVR
jgi:FMN phosphatase YigB (HAD superfamily)